jgi:DNA modification methylase
VTEYYRDEQVTLLLGDALETLRTLPDGSVDCIVTSPPYYGLRDYGVPGQYGLEASPAEYVERLCDVFREARRVLADDGTLWLNLGDSYAAATGRCPSRRRRARRRTGRRRTC